MNNNPIGIFVTPDLKAAKEFGDTVMEFHVSGEEFIDAFLASGNAPRDLTREEIAKIFVNNLDVINDFTWNDRQADRIRADLKRDYP